MNDVIALLDSGWEGIENYLILTLPDNFRPYPYDIDIHATMNFILMLNPLHYIDKKAMDKVNKYIDGGWRGAWYVPYEYTYGTYDKNNIVYLANELCFLLGYERPEVNEFYV